MDLNLIRVFVAIYETRSLTLASERLFVTQSAVSQSLSKLRNQFDDVLFQRSPAGMNPTVNADKLYLTFREALTSVDKVLTEKDSFIPEISDHQFKVALSELGEIGWLPTIYSAVNSIAPNVRIEVVPLQREHLNEWLIKGQVDLAITPLALGGHFERKLIKRQSYVVVMSSHNPLVEQELSIDKFKTSPRIMVHSDSGAALIESAFNRAGINSQPKVTVQHFTTLPQLISEDSELVALIPESIATGWSGKWPLALKPLPFDMEPAELNLYRRHSTEQQSALEWFYNTVKAAISDSEGEFAVIQ